MKLRYIAIFLISSLFIFANVNAGEQPQLTHQFGGTVQTWASFSQIGPDTNNAAFGLRRVRFRYYAQYDEVKLFVQSELTSGSLLDARIEYYFNDAFNVRAGRFIGAGVRSGGLTSHTKIDIIERPISARKWGAMTVGSDYRDYGFQVEGNVSSFTGRLWVHNGDGSTNNTNRAGDFYSDQDKTRKKGDSLPSAVDAMIIHKPESIKGLEVGGHYGIGNEDIGRDYSSYSVYGYYSPGPLRIKAELISHTTNGVAGADDKNMMGYYLFGGYSLSNNFELLGRFENYDPNTDFDDDGLSLITVGAAYNKFDNTSNNRVVAAIVLPTNEGSDLDDMGFQVMWQFLFKTK
ncbi:MAG: hypothetical protein D8M58_02710 [Calditrichaeota bacterium]|nr:MAG: hypothetical protein DWQ03_04370 [Calditrichota bacterium]MBL1204275.1 hypothetical protein [Calditrichota bacterium]NOG44105.1 hypothetical protein [Calditrichota bacterium]